MCGVRIQSIFSWPTCAGHHALATSTLYDSFYNWVWKSSYEPHGPVHTWLGGMVDCEETLEELEELIGQETATILLSFSFIHRKVLYRNKMWMCQPGVTADVSDSPAEVRIIIMYYISGWSVRYALVSDKSRCPLVGGRKREEWAM